MESFDIICFFALNVSMGSLMNGAFREPKFDSDPFIPESEKHSDNSANSQESKKNNFPIANFEESKILYFALSL